MMAARTCAACLLLAAAALVAGDERWTAEARRRWPRARLNASALFALIGRDVAHELPHVLANVASLAAGFRHARILFVENDSRDGTVAAFRRWAASSRAAFLDADVMSLKLGGMGHKSLQALAAARNAYLDALRSDPRYGPRSVDFLIAVDTDMCFPWRLGPIAAALAALLPLEAQRPPAWHVLSANGMCGWYTAIRTAAERETAPEAPGAAPVYCDLYALRDQEGRHRGTFDFFPVPGTGCAFVGADGVGCTQLAGQTVFPVQSAFGGLAIYSAATLRGDLGSSVNGSSCRYTASACEHVGLHACLHQAGARQLVATGLAIDWEGCESGKV